MNRESIPLLLALLVPICFVSIIALYYYGYDLTLIFRKIDIIYYIIILPIGLGFTVCIVKYFRPD